MIQFNFSCPEGVDIYPVKEKLHNALVGSPAYINSEIAICDGDTNNTFALVVGNNSENESDNVTIGIALDNITVTNNEEQPVEGEPLETMNVDEVVGGSDAVEIKEDDAAECDQCKIPEAEAKG